MKIIMLVFLLSLISVTAMADYTVIVHDDGTTTKVYCENCVQHSDISV